MTNMKDKKPSSTPQKSPQNEQRSDLKHPGQQSQQQHDERKEADAKHRQMQEGSKQQK